MAARCLRAKLESRTSDHDSQRDAAGARGGSRSAGMIGNGVGGAVAGAVPVYGAAVPAAVEAGADAFFSVSGLPRSLLASVGFPAAAGSFAVGSVSAVDPAWAGAETVLAL